MTTNVEQFVEDFTLVIDNNRDAFFEAIDCASHHVHLHEISDCMRSQYENAISSALEVLSNSEEVEEVTVDLMRELLTGWAQVPFDRIARHYQEKAGE